MGARADRTPNVIGMEKNRLSELAGEEILSVFSVSSFQRYVDLCSSWTRSGRIAVYSGQHILRHIVCDTVEYTATILGVSLTKTELFSRGMSVSLISRLI